MTRTNWLTLLLLAALFFVGTFAFGQSLSVQGTVTLAPCQAVQMVGSTVYAATASDFLVIDASNPASPSVVGQVSTGTGSISAIAVSQNFAYCAGQAAGLIIVNITDPAHPSIAAQAAMSSSARGVDKRDTLVAVATANSVVLVGVTNPAQPHILTSFGRASSWVQFDPAGNRLHVGSTAGAFDLSVTYSGGTAHLSNVHSYGSGTATPLAVVSPNVDIANGALLTVIAANDYSFVGQYQATSQIKAVNGTGGFAFAGLGSGSVVMLNQLQGAPQFAASSAIPAEPSGIALGQAGGQPVIAVSHHSGVSILSYSTSSAAEEIPSVLPRSFSLSAFPNPFNSVVGLELTVPKAGRYDLVVYDLLGNEVRRENLPLSGTTAHRVSFAGMSSGMYFARLSDGSLSATTKLFYLP